ncbi:hypothetical protein TNCT_526691, partial [Trichonephila clavata]
MSWSTSTDNFGSDHFPIIINYKRTNSSTTNNFRQKTNWNKFINLIQQKLNLDENINIDVVEEIRKAQILSQESEKNQINSRAPWWTAACGIMPRREGSRESCSPRASASHDNRQRRRHSLPRDVARTQPGLLVQDRALDLNDPDNITSRNRNVEDNRQIEAADEVDMEPVPGPFGDVEQNVAPVPVCSEYSTEYQLFARFFFLAV